MDGTISNAVASPSTAIWRLVAGESSVPGVANLSIMKGTLFELVWNMMGNRRLRTIKHKNIAFNNRNANADDLCRTVFVCLLVQPMEHFADLDEPLNICDTNC